MNLQQLQAGFMAAIHDADAPLPMHWRGPVERGLQVYRSNYRHALMDMMHATFERALRWVGEAAFDAAAAHHLVVHPPSGWTLDEAGAGFADTVADLFPRDPEAGDLAALEWAMHRAFTAADAAAMGPAEFRAATGGFVEADWAGMCLLPQPGLAVVTVRTDCIALWRALADGPRPADPPLLDAPHAAIVWREDWRPVCCLGTADEGEALRLAAAGVGYGNLCASLAERHGADGAAREAGRLLSWWLQAGLLSGIAPGAQPGVACR